MRNQRIQSDRLNVANQVLAFINAKLEIDRGYIVVSWTTHKGETVRRRWQTRNQDFYPVWKRQWPHGGTMTRALSQLIRWVKNRPVLPLHYWAGWTGESVRLFGDDGPKVVEILREGGYPTVTKCVKCGQEPTRGIDWWSLDGVSGPCCLFECSKSVSE